MMSSLLQFLNIYISFWQQGKKIRINLNFYFISIFLKMHKLFMFKLLKNVVWMYT